MTRKSHGSCALATIVLALSGNAWGSGFEFNGRLTGAQEVPAVETTTLGSIAVEFDPGFTRARFKLKVFDGADVTQAHFHCNRAGQNGPAVAFLYGLGPTIDVDGVLAEGLLTNASFTGADCVPIIGRPINNLAALAFGMRDGLIYANVHTVAHPPGEVRAQIVAADGKDDDSASRGRGRKHE